MFSNLWGLIITRDTFGTHYKQVKPMSQVLPSYFSGSPPDKVASSTMFSGGLSKALCCKKRICIYNIIIYVYTIDIQRCIRECAVGVKIKPRILV